MGNEQKSVGNNERKDGIEPSGLEALDRDGGQGGREEEPDRPTCRAERHRGTQEQDR